jgi:hypothetical protein
MLTLDIKKKMHAVADHVKSHPTAYCVGLALAVSATAQYVYNTKKGMIYLNDVTKEMRETGKGVYFRDTNTGTTIIAALYNPETMPDLTFLD